MVNIAIATDGESSRQQQMGSQFKNEIRDLLKGEFSPNFIDFRGDWNGASIQAALDQVLVLGIATSQIAAVRDAFPKLTFLPLLFTAELFCFENKF